MFALPHSTVVNRRVAKEKLYAHATMTTTVKNMLKNQVEAIVWQNKLADSTTGVAPGKNVQEMQVFTVGLRQKELDKRVLTAIAQAIPYKILFILTYQGLAQAWLEVENTFYHTEWQPLAGLKLTFSGTNLDNVYENLARQIAGDRLSAEQNLAQAVARDKQRDKITRAIKALQQKISQEKQFNRQVELNGELKKLQAAMEQL